MSDIRFYCGVSNRVWGRALAAPGPYACISPVTGRTESTRKQTWVYVPDGTEVIQDSGAFSDSPAGRLSFADAFERQIKHGEQHSYQDCVTHRATYDMLIDEVWTEGNRAKRRWSPAAAESAVDTTIAAAAWLDKHRAGPIIISAQGVDAAQYMRCAGRCLAYFRPGDMFALGGWCITGKLSRVMMPVFIETVRILIPFLALEGIKHVHIWGVIYPAALATLYNACQAAGLSLSTDSAGPALNPINSEWGFGVWRDNRYRRPDDPAALGDDRRRHVELTRAWLDSFSTSIDYLSRFPAGNTSQNAARRLPAGICDPATDRQTVTRPCVICGREMVLKRQHSRTCSDRCRKALSRQFHVHKNRI